MKKITRRKRKKKQKELRKKMEKKGRMRHILLGKNTRDGEKKTRKN
jgi:hypothetical protein